jgi:flagellar protein FliJ
MKFNFRLQKVLELREHQEENVKNQLAILTKELESEKIKLHNYLKEQSKVLSDINTMIGKIINMEDLLFKRNYINKLDGDISMQKKIIQHLKNEHKTKIKEYIEINKKLKVLEKLKEKKLSIFKKELEDSEQLFLDEIGRNLYIKKLDN